MILYRSEVTADGDVFISCIRWKMTETDSFSVMPEAVA